MATTSKPWASSRRDAARACSAAPMITGTIGLCASARFSAAVKALALCNGRAVSSGSASMISRAARAAATQAGGGAVE